MPSLKGFLIFVVLIIIAFGVGYGLGYLKLHNAQVEWAKAADEMKGKISGLEKDLARMKARESLRDMSDSLSLVMDHFSEKNFGLAAKTLEGMKETFGTLQAILGEEWKGKFGFFLPAIDEIKKEAEHMTPDAKKKTEELKNLWDQALKPGKKD